MDIVSASKKWHYLLGDYEEECGRCDGAGAVLCNNDYRPKDCPRCGGAGKVPSERGEQLLEFIKSHLNLEIK